MERIEELYIKYQKDLISENEREEFFNLVRSADGNSLRKLADRYLAEKTPSDLEYLNADTDRIMFAIRKRISDEGPKVRKIEIAPWIKLMVAAASILGCLFFVYRYNTKDVIKAGNEKNSKLITDVAPGGNHAFLTLADGRKILLDTAYTGKLAEIGGTRISKTADGELVYESNLEPNAIAQTNIVTIPRGGEYRLFLPDGTRVWLNASTSIKYPTKFDGAERKVFVSGEAYFEVAKDPEHPFIVQTDQQEIKVLGTHFNVRTYNKARTITTLAEGSVKVMTTNGFSKSIVIKPGQQAVLTNNNLLSSNADIEAALAWKNGLLFFRDAPLEQVLEEVARWYDIDVEYQGEIPKKTFTGGVNRSSNLSAMLRILNFTGVKAKIVINDKSRKLIVEP